ncbi:MAG: chromosome partitioning protein ParB, partial [Spirochaetales bacterium]|nr:chromosome partitioning protein ParB [Spirochaetales bacterium]
SEEMKRSGFRQKKPISRSTTKQAPELREIEQHLLESLGTKVQVKGSLSKGRIEVSYYSTEDLERLTELLTGK